ncbi:MAG: prepilin-type N-terminal cleavage/methylation domain-containing protein [Leptospirillia bacterium]
MDNLNTRSRLLGEDGFTLLEVMIAAVVVVVGLVGVAGLAMTTVQGNDSASKLTAATVLSQDMVEEIRTSGYANSVPAGSTAAIVNIGGTDYTANTLTEDYGSTVGDAFKRVTVVTENYPVVYTNMVVVTTYWNNDGNDVELSTFIAREWE